MESRASILLKTNGGLKLFLLLLPKLIMLGSKNKTNIDSPISRGKSCFSVFEWKGKYWFKDHYSKAYGDIFELVAIMNNLNSKAEFQKVLEIIEKMLESNIAAIPECDKINYIDTSNGDILCLVSIEYSKPFVENYFMESLPYLNTFPSYIIQLVQSFELTQQNINYEFDFAKPREAVYAIVVRAAQYFILFDPVKKVSYEWGRRPEFYLFGMDKLFQNAYVENIYYRDTLVLTNKVEGVLWCEDKEIPCLAILAKEHNLDGYISQVILKKFAHKYLLFHALGEGGKLADSLSNRYGFTNIFTGHSYLYQFFNCGEEALEKVIDQLHQCEDFEYDGVENPVQIFQVDD